jgi:hypothetical protein
MLYLPARKITRRERQTVFNEVTIVEKKKNCDG